MVNCLYRCRARGKPTGDRLVAGIVTGSQPNGLLPFVIKKAEAGAMSGAGLNKAFVSIWVN